MSMSLNMNYESDILVENTHKMLKKLVSKAIHFRIHHRHERITTEDMKKASDFYLFNENSKHTETLIDLESYIEQELVKPSVISYSVRCFNSNFVLSPTFKMDRKSEEYFTLTIKALFSKNKELLLFSLADLKKNTYILPLVPIFVDSLCNDYIFLKCKRVSLKRILHLMNNLYTNPSLYFRNQDIFKLLNFVLLCTTKHLPAICSQKEDCSLQDFAAKFLSDILTSNPHLKFLFDFSMGKLQAPLEASEVKLQQCYGSLVALVEIGFPAVAYVIPHVFVNFSHKLDIELANKNLQSKKLELTSYGDRKNMATAVYSKLLDASELFLKNYLHETEQSTQVHLCILKNSNSFICEEVEDESVIFDTCKNIIEYFGNTLILRIPSLKDKLSAKQSLIELFTSTKMPEKDLSKDNQENFLQF